MLSKTAAHALKAVVVLAEHPGEFQGAAKVAERIDAPRNYLGKMLQILSREGIVASQKGFGGGFQLARAAEDVTLYDVVEPIDKLSKWDGCFINQSFCPEKGPCPLHERWEGIRDGYLSMLKESTVADLVSS